MKEKDVRYIISEALHQPEDLIVRDASLADDLGADSLDMQQIYEELETTYDITFTKDDEQAIVTVGDLYDETRRKCLARYATMGKQ